MDNTVYYILGIVALIYIVISAFNRKRSRERKSRKFMDGYDRRNKKK